MMKTKSRPAGIGDEFIVCSVGLEQIFNKTTEKPEIKIDGQIKTKAVLVTDLNEGMTIPAQDTIVRDKNIDDR